MPHKRNPVSAVLMSACAQRIPGLVATALGAMVQEHQRAAGAWHAEWETYDDVLRLLGAAAGAARELLAGLEADPGRMRANLDGLPLAAPVAAALAARLGRVAAHDLVADVVAHAGDAPLDKALRADPRITLTDAEIDAALDPAAYLGQAGELVDRARAAHQQGRLT
jgi:3-carboxy-cis,cis-muconate cycloisomerase